MRFFLPVVVFGGVSQVLGAALPPADAQITPAPTLEDIELLLARQLPDAVSFAQILLSAVPSWIRQVAVTNIPAASSIVNDEFLDGQRPDWFYDLPQDVQSYLVGRFGPQSSTSAPLSSSGASSPADTTTNGDTSTAQTASPSATDSSSQMPTTTRLPTSLAVAKSSSSPTAGIISPPTEHAGLSKKQKIGLGVGLPLTLLAIAAALLLCCLLSRRRRNRKHVAGREPPSSPGFIPRSAFHERPMEEHRMPLKRNMNRSSLDLKPTAWDDEGADLADAAVMHNPHSLEDPYTLSGSSSASRSSGASSVGLANHPPGSGLGSHDAAPAMEPVLFPTHTSNRARGKRTSYASLSSVAEVSEPGDRAVHGSGPRRLSQAGPVPSRGSGMGTSPLTQVRRKPVPIPPSLAIGSANPQNNSRTNGYERAAGHDAYDAVSPISPISNQRTSNPFTYDGYVEDYGPEYHTKGVSDAGANGRYYASERSSGNRGSSPKTEWPLRDFR